MNPDEMFRIENAVFVLGPRRELRSGGRPLLQQAGLGIGTLSSERFAYLTRSIDYFGRKFLTSVLDDFVESVLDGGVVAVHKMPIHKLYCK